MPKAKVMTAWEAVKAVERSNKLKDEFFDLSAKAYEKNPKETQRIRRMLARREITLHEALRRLKRIAG